VTIGISSPHSSETAKLLAKSRPMTDTERLGQSGSRVTSSPNGQDSYVLATAAYNEEALIEQTIQSIVGQTLLPSAWIIVSDGSSDRTDQIVQSYSVRFPFIELLRVERTEERNFGSKVHALHVGLKRLRKLSYRFIGNLDADLSFDTTYFERLIERFRLEPKLGVAGGWIHEQDGGRFRPRRFNSTESVPHGVHLLRRECYEAVGDYLPLRYGGEDTWADVTARMNGWEVRAFADLPVLHHRKSASAGGLLRNRFKHGLMHRSLGYLPRYEVLSCLRRVRQNPVAIGAIMQIAGFCYGYLRPEVRLVSSQFVTFLRNEQRKRLRQIAWLGRD
jgi:poly-beta-1,6-N-acetyl-D-glucosamine synthase